MCPCPVSSNNSVTLVHIYQATVQVYKLELQLNNKEMLNNNLYFTGVCEIT